MTARSISMTLLALAAGAALARHGRERAFASGVLHGTQLTCALGPVAGGCGQ